MVTKFLSFDQFCHFFDHKNYDFKYSHMCDTKRLDETNSTVYEKNNLNVNRVPKMGYKNLPKHLQLSIFRQIDYHK